MSILELSIQGLRDQFLSGILTYEEIVREYLRHIKQTDGKIAAYLYVDSEKAIEKAIEIDKRFQSGQSVGKLAGIPVAIKDNIVTKAMPTTCGSKMLENYYSPFDATVVTKIIEEDGVIIGKLNMDEFAMGSTTENSYYQSTKNPHDLNRVPGGSSGGSAACVASNQAVITLGSDTGGSIRQPAAFCGIVGLKPTYGRISRNGLIAFASSLDQIGPMARSVEDLAYVMPLLFGKDPMDSTSSDMVVEDYTAFLGQDLKGLRVAIPKNFLNEKLNVEIKDAILHAGEVFKSLGATVEYVEITSVDYALPAYYIISSAEASSNLARFDGIQYGFRPEGDFTLDELYKASRSQGLGKEVKRRILLGTYALSSGYYDAYYKKAQQVRSMIKSDFDRVFEDYDLILSPTAPTTAYEIGLKSEDPIEMYLGDIFTVPINIAGLPALSMNGGYDSKGLPIGIQLIGKAFDEKTLIKAAHGLEGGLKDE
ncbi:MAG: Asp-tRNA(Asn)/Glu-tRNA(Gln) amidotransferase subunit GatA [Clostridia bacterium]|nr:Asp-tRNA(Asn)/Glu-tRNA(Gln) amidotransferase subunit GatA [Clostridia bacterium]